MPFDDEVPGGGSDVDDGAGDDDFSNDDPGSGDPGSGEGEGGGDPDDLDPQSLDGVVEDAEREALEDYDPDEDDDDDDGDRRGRGSDKGEGRKGRSAARRAPSDDDPVEKFIQENYGGDREAFLRGQLESRREAKRLKEENDQLKRSPRSDEPKLDRAAEVKKAEEASAEVQSLNQTITTISTRYKAIEQDQVKIVADIGKLNDRATALRAELPHIEDQKQWAQKYAELGSLQQDIVSLRSDYNNNEVRMDRLADKHDDAKDKLARARKAITDEMDAQEKQAETVARNAEATRRVFGQSFTHAIKQFGLDPVKDKARYNYVRESIRAQTWNRLDDLASEGHPGLDGSQIFDLVTRLVSEYARHNGLRAGGRRAGPSSGRPPQDRHLGVPGRRLDGGRRAPDNRGGGSGGGNGTGVGKRSLDAALDDPDFVRKRAQAIQQGIARQAQQRQRAGAGRGR